MEKLEIQLIIYIIIIFRDKKLSVIDIKKEITTKTPKKNQNPQKNLKKFKSQATCILEAKFIIMPAQKTASKTSSDYIIDLAKPVKDNIIDIADFV